MNTAKTLWCGNYEVVGDVEGGGPALLDADKEVCICATTKPPDTAFEERCLADWLIATDIACNQTVSVQDSGSCGGADTDSVPYEGTGEPPDNDCQMMAPNGMCCDEITAPADCCGPDGICAHYDYGNFPYEAPVQVSPHRAILKDSSIKVVFGEGTLDEDEDTVPLVGVLDYALSDCGETYCPFFWNGMEAAATSSLDLDITIGGVTKAKSFRNLTFRLLYPVFGRHHIGEVLVGEFSRYGVMLLVEVDVDGPEFASENGHYAFVSRNASDITTQTDPLNHEFTFNGLAGALDISGTTGLDLSAEITHAMSLTDEPPAAAGSVTLDACNIHCGRGDYDFVSTSTDPDNDLSLEMWWVDDVLVHVGDSFTHELLNGLHTWTLRVFDARGAYDSYHDEVLVDCGACSP